MKQEKALAGLSVGIKLWIGVLLLVVAQGALVLQTSIQSRAITAEAESVLSVKGDKLQLATRWTGLTETNLTRVQASFISADPRLQTLYQDLIPQTEQRINEVQTRLAELATSAPDRELMQRIAAQRQAVLDSLARARDLRQQGNAEGAMQEIEQRFNTGIPPYIAGLREFAELQHSQLQQSQGVFAERREANMRNGSILMGLLFLLILGGAGLLIRSIRNPLVEVAEFAQQMAQGNLGVRLALHRRDEFGQMARSLNAMREQIAQVVSDVRQGTDGITAVAHEIAVGGQNLSARSEQSAGNLERTAASMESMSDTIGHSAASARTASELARTAGQSAQQGREVVGSVVHTMNEIQQASKKSATSFP